MTRLEKLLELYETDKTDPFVRYGIALEYNALQEYDNALQWFEELRRTEPDYVPTYYMLAGVYRALERYAEAVEIYKQGMSAARKAGDSHAFAELQAALEELEDE